MSPSAISLLGTRMALDSGALSFGKRSEAYATPRTRGHDNTANASSIDLKMAGRVAVAR